MLARPRSRPIENEVLTRKALSAKLALHGMKTTTKTDRRALLAALLIAALAVLAAALVGLAEEAAGFPINH